MSEWVKIRDTIINALNVEKVTEDVKQSFTLWLLETALPLAKESAKNFIAQTTEQAGNEKRLDKNAGFGCTSCHNQRCSLDN